VEHGLCVQRGKTGYGENECEQTAWLQLVHPPECAQTRSKNRRTLVG